MVSDQIIKVLDNLCDKFGLAIDWSSKNVQPYLKELMAKCVNYKFSIATMWLISGIILFIISCIGIKIGIFCKKKYDEIEELTDWDVAATLTWVLSGAGMIGSVSMIFSNIITIITCRTFPEKIIVDMIQTYLK